MTPRRRPLLVLLGAAALVAGGSAPASAAPVVTTEPLQLTQPEAMCGGEEVLVTYDGELTTRTVTTGSGRTGTSVRFRADLAWEQDGVAHTGQVTGAITEQPGGRTTSYRFAGSGVGSDGRRVHLLEVVHARRGADGELRLLVEVERITCR